MSNTHKRKTYVLNAKINTTCRQCTMNVEMNTTLVQQPPARENDLLVAHEMKQRENE